MFELVKMWISQRIKERTSWDGVAIIAAGVVYLVFEPIASLVAYAAIGYGVWTLWKKEKGD